MPGRLSLLAWLAVSGCGVDFAGDEGEEPLVGDVVGDRRQAILGGTETTARPEVGFTSTSCTATLISPRLFVTAAHCTGRARQDGGTLTVAGTQIPIDTTLAFSRGRPSSYDVALGVLAHPAPGWIAPARFQTVEPAANSSITLMGFGCSISQAIKRFRSGLYGQTNFGCQGDSGGPAFTGLLNENGAVFGVNSGGGREVQPDLFGILGTVAPRLEVTIRSFGLGLELDFDRPGFDLAGGIGPAADAVDCFGRCQRNLECRAMTFVNGTCHLKWATPPLVPAVGMVSGIPHDAHGTFNLAGGDFAAFPSANADACRVECAKDTARCRGYTFFQGTCFLKDGAVGITGCNPCASGFANRLEVGVDRPGADGRVVANITSATACAGECARDGTCRSFSWVDATDRCFLKTQVPAPVARAGITSGVRRGIEPSTNRPGSDYRSFALSAPDPHECQAACARESECVAWTMTFPPAVDVSARCWLKTAAPARFPLDGAVSGLKSTEFM